MKKEKKVGGQKAQRITGIGSALVDVLINETDQFLTQVGKQKGGMTYHSDSEIQNILSQTNQTPLIVPGGSACNTIVGVARLGGRARFIGRLGRDEFGQLFHNQLQAAGVEPKVSLSDTPTGKVLSVVTPDAQRSMFTCLGASVEMKPEQVSTNMFQNTAITIIEGYLLFNSEMMKATLKAAKEAGTLVALDLASFEVVNQSKDLLNEIVNQYVDILIANEDEAAAFTGSQNEEKALNILSENVTWAVLKVGARGSIIKHKNTITPIEPIKGLKPLDTTGAGDLWAAGFLFGLSQGFDITTCGKLGSACGYEVCQIMGAHIPEEGWKKIKKLI